LISYILGCSIISADFYFDLNDKDRPKGPIEANDSLLEELLEQDPRESTRNLAIQLNCSFNMVSNR